MPTYEVEDPTTGKVLELDGDSPPTEQELEEIFASVGASPTPAPSAPAEDESPGLFASVFPSTSEAVSEGGALTAPKAALGAFTDVLSIPQRASATVTGQKFSDPNSYIGRSAVENRWEGGADRREEMFKPVKGNPAQTGMNMMIGGAIDQPEEIAKPIREIAVRTATDPLSYAAAVPKALGAVGAAGKALNKGSGKLAQELSGVSEEALRLGATKAGRQQLRQASGRQAEIGNKLTDAISDYHQYLPEKDIVENALKQMPPVDITKTIEALERTKIKPRGGVSLLPHQARANAEIDAIISGVRGKGNVTHIPAEDAYHLRRDFDYNLDFDKPETKLVDRALKEARTQLKNDLLRSAGSSGKMEYAHAMKDWARKLNLLDKINSRLGLTKNTREARSEAFVKNLFGKNSAHKQELLKDLDEVFGTDLLKQSRMTFLADEIGEGGKAAILPRQTTGRATMSAAGATVAGALGLGSPGTALLAGTLAAHSSPFVASRGILPTTQAIESALNNGVFKTAKSKALAKAFTRTTNAATQARIADQLRREMEKAE